MAHLTNEQLLALARSDEDSVLRQHTLECAECAQGEEMWRLAIESLPSVLHERVDETEMHNLQAMFRHNGPEQSSVGQWLATLVRSMGKPVPASIRGSSAADLYEYEAGPFTMMLESGPLQAGSYSIHGQVFHDVGSPLTGARVVLASDDGTAFVEPLDEFGEFHVDVTKPGLYNAMVWTEEGTFRVEDLQVGDFPGG